jgi:hypothetical protein
MLGGLVKLSCVVKCHIPLCSTEIHDYSEHALMPSYYAWVHLQFGSHASPQLRGLGSFLSSVWWLRLDRLLHQVCRSEAPVFPRAVQ